jgi:serine phosphatase RsbU (regulator of sigma subunit)
LYPGTKPHITEIALQHNTYVVVFTDGLLKAGERYGEDLNLANYLAGWPASEGASASSLADALLGRAIELDRGHPTDDMSIVVLAVLPPHPGNRIRRMAVVFPIDNRIVAERHDDIGHEDWG